MSFGLEIFGTDGTKIFSSDDLAVYIVDFFQVSANASGSITKPEYEGCYVVSNPINTSSTNPYTTIPVAHYYPHQVTITGTTLTYAPMLSANYSDPNGDFQQLRADSQILVLKVI